MRISLDHLRRYCPGLPRNPVLARDLLDDIGIEVKRIEEAGRDCFLNLELLANRGDHRCYVGVAREVVGRLGGSLQLPAVTALETGDGGILVRLETDLCLNYTATPMARGEVTSPLPETELIPLVAAGLQSLGAVVDATNLVNLEFGQPTHCFDADAVTGAITVRTSLAGERAWPLFGEEPLILPAGILVIADEVRILAIAGVIGCEESKVTARTRRIILESAAFDPVAVRKGSRTLRIQTDASARFERGSDPLLTITGNARVVHLLEAYAGYRRLGPTTVAGNWRDPGRTIALDLGRLSDFFSRPFQEGEVRRHLEPCGFLVAESGGATLSIRVPPHRLWDVVTPEDIYEEIARLVGYDSLPESLPMAAVGALPSEIQDLRAAVDAVLNGMGFYEIMTPGFYDRRIPARLGLDKNRELGQHVETENALDAGFSLLKSNCLGQAIEAVAENLRFGTEAIKMYEWTRTFHPAPDGASGGCREVRRLWLAACGPARDASWADKSRPADIWMLRGIVEELAVELRLPLRIGPSDLGHALSTCLHPHRQAEVLLGDTPIGLLGEIHPKILRAFGIKRGRPCYLELETDHFSLAYARDGVSLPPPRPLSIRMLAFTLPPRVNASEVVDSLQDNGPAWLDRIEIVDLFHHEEDGLPVRTITYSLAYRNDQTEHSSDELNAVTERLAQAVQSSLSNKGVKFRYNA